MIRKFLLGLTTALLMMSTSISAQDISVGDATMPPLKWGEQTVTMEVTNNSEYLKFLIFKIDVGFSESYLTPERSTTSNAMLLPDESRDVTVKFFIPGNYGRAAIKVVIYDVVDTLDIILPGQKIFEQPFVLTYRQPEAVVPYLSEKITLPPRVNEHPDFDNEFARLLILMINEGKTLEEITKICEADSVMAADLVQRMKSSGYLSERDGLLKLSFSVIDTEEADEVRQLAVLIADSLSRKIKANLPAFKLTIDSLVAANAMSGDTDVFYDPGSILHHLYPVVGAWVLWHDIGRKFVTRSAPLLLYDNTDPCNAKVPYYMYAVRGSDVVNGNHFYAPYYEQRVYTILYGDAIPTIDCEGWYRPQHRHNNWAPQLKYSEEFKPDIFVVDTAVIMPAVRKLSGDTDKLLGQAYSELFRLSDKYGHYKVLFGHRYWFWNLVATKTLEKLEKDGVVTREGNGQYRFDGQPSETFNR